MKTKRGALASLLLALACTYHLPAQSTGESQFEAPLPPEPVNIDIPPEEPPDPEFIMELELATLALEHPREFHEWLLQLEPGRRGRKEREELAILNPGKYKREHPNHGLDRAAEMVAEHVILNPRVELPFFSQQN